MQTKTAEILERHSRHQQLGAQLQKAALTDSAGAAAPAASTIPQIDNGGLLRDGFGAFSDGGGVEVTVLG